MLLFRAWWRRGEKERRGVEVVSSCIFLVLPPQNKCSGSQSSQQQMFGADLGFVQRGCLDPLTPQRCWGSCPPSPPQTDSVSQASRREFLLHCALVVLGNADLRPCGSGSAVVRRSLLAPGWPRRWRGLSGRWAASSFLPGLWLEWMWDSNFLPLSDSSESGHRENKSEETTKFQWSFSRFLGFFLSFHPISWSSSVHSLVNNSGKPQAAKSDPCIFSDAEGI